MIKNFFISMKLTLFLSPVVHGMIVAPEFHFRIKGSFLKTVEPESSVPHGISVMLLVMGMCDINSTYEYDELDTYVKDFYTSIQGSTCAMFIWMVNAKILSGR